MEEPWGWFLERNSGGQPLFCWLNIMEGYIKLYRKIKENKYWLEPRKFSKLEAWIDLLLRASFKDKALVVGDVILSLKAGQFVTSQVKLSEAWGWNRETVNKYLKQLKNDKQIYYKTSNKFTLITISNWDNYQNPDKEKPATEPAAKPATAQHQGNTKTDTINNDKNEKDIKHIFIMKTQILELSQRYKNDKILIKGHLLKEGYTEFQIEDAFQKYAR